MIYIRFENSGNQKYGILDKEVVKELQGNYFEDLIFTGKTYLLKEVKLLAPCIPSKVVAVGLNYVDHVYEFSGKDLPKNPILFIKLPHTVISHEEEIIIPKNATRVDYEAELAVVIKKKCSKVTPEESNEYLLGATCLNDVTERDIQKSDGQWTRGKNFETFCPIGPYIVLDLDYNSLDIKLLLNEEVKQHSNTSMQIWKVPELVSFISQVIPLFPGDVITTGTPSGVGPMQHGDVVEVQIEGLGTLKNYAI